MSHDHSHGHGHSHSHTHYHSHGHEVPWTGETGPWYEAGWADPFCRRAIEAAELRADDVLVDVDCGTAQALWTASAWIKRGQLVGVASHVAHLRGSTAEHPAASRIRFQAGSPEQLPIADTTATVAWSIDALARWTDPARCVAELHRVLQPGGRLFIAADASACGIDAASPDDPTPLQALLRAQRFRGVEVRRYTDGPTRTVVFKASRSRR